MTEECAEKTVYLMSDREHTQVHTHTNAVENQRQGLTFKKTPAKHVVFSVSPDSVTKERPIFYILISIDG